MEDKASECFLSLMWHGSLVLLSAQESGTNDWSTRDTGQKASLVCC